MSSVVIEPMSLDDDVVEAARGAGIGRSLIEGLAGFARAEGFDFLELTSRPAREAANRLYRSLGFELRETNVYRLDHGA